MKIKEWQYKQQSYPTSPLNFATLSYDVFFFVAPAKSVEQPRKKPSSSSTSSLVVLLLFLFSIFAAAKHRNGFLGFLVKVLAVR